MSMTKITKESGDSDDDVSDIEIESNESGDEMDDLNLPSLLNHFFTNEDGENIAEILTQFKKTIDTQNKIIYKLLQGAAENNKK